MNGITGKRKSNLIRNTKPEEPSEMPNPDGSMTDAEYFCVHGRTREQVATEEARLAALPPPPSIEELLEMIVQRLDTLIAIQTKRDWRD
jgi:hypothetical protein